MRASRADGSSRAVDDRAAVLAGVGIFGGTGPRTIRKLAEATERVEVAPGADVVREQRVPTHFYIVGGGVLEVFSTGEGEHEPQRVATLQEGDHFGEIGLVEGMPATATVRAKTSCVLYRIPARDFLSAVAESPVLSGVLLDRIAGGLARTHPSYAPAARPDARGSDHVLSEVARIGEIVAPALRLPGEIDLLKSITATAVNLFDAAACSLALLRPDGSLEFTAASGAGAADVVGQVVAPGTGIAGAVAASPGPLLVDDVARDERFAATFADLTGYRPRAIVARRLESSRGTVGVIEVLDGAAFSTDRERSLVLLDLFSRLAAVAIENGRAFSDFGMSLLAAAATAAGGTHLTAALEDSLRRHGADPDVARLSVLVERIMQLAPAERREVIGGLSSRLDDGGPRGPL